jgi:hypothetical protein
MRMPYGCAVRCAEKLRFSGRVIIPSRLRRCVDDVPNFKSNATTPSYWWKLAA